MKWMAFWINIWFDIIFYRMYRCINVPPMHGITSNWKNIWIAMETGNWQLQTSSVSSKSFIFRSTVALLNLMLGLRYCIIDFKQKQKIAWHYIVIWLNYSAMAYEYLDKIPRERIKPRIHWTQNFNYMYIVVVDMTKNCKRSLFMRIVFT